MPAPSTDSTSSLQASLGQVPSQSKLREFNRRRAMIEYTLCNDEDIWSEMEKEEIQAKSARKEARKPKPLAVPTASQLESINAFLLDMFQNSWHYTQEQLDMARQNLKPEMISPGHIDWDQREQDRDVYKLGQYTLNHEIQNLNFEKAKVFIPDPKTLKEFKGKPKADLAKHIQITYGSKYHIPGIEYWQYIYQNPDKAPQVLKNSENNYFYFGSILRHRNGYWYVPISLWEGLSFSHNAFWLDSNWVSNERVVLLKSLN